MASLPPVSAPRIRTPVLVGSPGRTPQLLVAPSALIRGPVHGKPKAAPGPFGEGTSIHVCIHGACSNGGSAALLADLEELATHTGIKVATRGCLGLCGQGPNCLLQPPDPAAKTSLEKGVKTFSACKNVMQKALARADLNIPEAALLRARLKSDAIRLLSACVGHDSSGVLRDMQEAETLLAQAIALETQEAPPSQSSATRLKELRMLRGKVFGRCILADPSRRHEYGQRAIAEFDVVKAMDPSFAAAFAQSARIYTFLQRLKDAVENYRIALDIKKGHGVALSFDEAGQARRQMAKLQKRLAEHGEIDSIAMNDSGDGSGLWKVLEIKGLSRDSCIYQLGNLEPSEPHPCPHHLWHVQVHADGVMREYTPVSTASEWEAGRLDLLVKTYPSGKVSKSFGTLRSYEKAHERCQMNYSPIEDEPCWVFVSQPMLTLSLPMSVSCKITHLGIIVGGTGIAPAFQLLTQISDLECGFDTGCKIVLLYSSRTSIDVLMLDELRDLERAFAGQMKMQHFLTDEPDEGDPWDVLPQMKGFRGQHAHFASSWEPFEPREGILRVGIGEEAVRGCIDVEALRSLLSPPSLSSRIVLCGPQGFMDSMQSNLSKLAHPREHVMELKASPTPASSVEKCNHAEIPLRGDRSIASSLSSQAFPKADVEKKIEAPRTLRPLTFADLVTDTVRQATIDAKSVTSSS